MQLIIIKRENDGHFSFLYHAENSFLYKKGHNFLYKRENFFCTEQKLFFVPIARTCAIITI